MNPEFPIARFSLALLIAISAHTGLPGTEHEIVADSLTGKQETGLTREPALEQWQSVRNEMDLIYLSHPHLNPLEEPTLLEYSRQARAQIESLSESLHAIAYLLSSTNNGPRQFDLAVQTLTSSVRSYSLNSSN